MRTTHLHVVILGITGSIGQQTLKIAKQLGYKVVGCSYHSNHKLGKTVIKSNSIPYYLCTSDSNKGNCSDYDDLIKQSKPDLVVNAIIGFAGLKATISALNNHVNIALANKESVVVGGFYIFNYAKKHNIKIIPIDSEHTNLYYQLSHCQRKDVNQLYITGSGGKYWNIPKSKLAKVDWAQATTHKNWSMGSKITIDSNTLMNKCFEVIEAYWYFNTKRINVLLDPTSIIHSGLLMNDGTFWFSQSKPLMTWPIAQALTNFNYKMPKSLEQSSITDTLVKINDVLPIKWAFDVMNDKTNSLSIIINSANEVAIKLFANKMLKFNQIIDFIANAVKKIPLEVIKTPTQIYRFDKKVRLLSIKYWK